MAQNITLLGASYSDVPSVLLPKTGGGTASFTDVTDTTAAASDVASGKYFYTSAGVRTQGTSTGGGGTEAGTVTQDADGYLVLDDDPPTHITVEALNVTQNGTYTAPTGKAYSPVTVNVSGGTGDLKAIIERTATTPALPSDLTTVGDYAFYNCTSLALTSLPSGVTSIGQYAFYNCTNLALTSLPSGITSIGDYAFYNCTKLALTSLPSGVTAINGRVFYGCTSLVSMTCTGSITTFGALVFTNCSNLETVSFPNMTISSLGVALGANSAVNACQKLEFADIGSTKAIAANAFKYCYALQTLVLRRSDAICTLANVSAFTNTPMDGYNSLTGTVYVPNALIDTYKTATNWSTLYNNGTVAFAAIEGSDYELE